MMSIFSYEDKGVNCPRAVFEMMLAYWRTTTQLPDSSTGMFNEIESLFMYILQLVEQNNIGMDRVINSTNEAGNSLFHLATLFSEQISLELLKRNVKVDKIDNQFNTLYFRVS